MVSSLQNTVNVLALVFILLFIAAIILIGEIGEEKLGIEDVPTTCAILTFVAPFAVLILSAIVATILQAAGLIASP